MRVMKHKSDIFPPGAHPIVSFGRSAGDRGGTSPPAEGNFHGKPEPPPGPTVLETASGARRRARGDPSSGLRAHVIGRPERKRPVDYEHRILGPPGGGWRERAQGPPIPNGRDPTLPERKRPVDYEHRILGPPDGGWRERAQGPPSLWIGPAPPGHFRSRRGGPPGATQDTFHSLSAERRRDARLATLPETTRQGRRKDKHVNQGR